MPSNREWLILASTGVSSTIGHLFVNSAYKHPETSPLTPFVYLEIFSASAMGWLGFNQLPDSLTALGIAIICASGAATAYDCLCRDHRHRWHPIVVTETSA
jgi:drug/metabolite transporter (DMT)-like permease